MSARRRAVWTAALLAVASLAGSAAISAAVERERPDANLQEMMYVSSPSAVKKMSLGYQGLLADIYWTRAVQYFGSKHHRNDMQYKLLDPILRITTTLDPKLTVAYSFGSTFLAQNPPQGAGDPQAAVRLVKQGIEANPEAWRLRYLLGCIQWQELNDPLTASESFLKGSQVPGARPWMKVMAAALAAKAGEEETSRYLWKNIYESSQEQSQKDNAVKHLQALDASRDVRQLQAFIDLVAQRTGQRPQSFRAMVDEGLLRRIPVDPLGRAYRLRDGRVELDDEELSTFMRRADAVMNSKISNTGSGSNLAGH